MKILPILMGIAVLFTSSHTLAKDDAPMFSHIVFFDLTNNDEPSKQALIDGAHKYLAPHDGIAYFAVGERAADKNRDVNDQEFDISLVIIFKDQDSQDAYQTTDAHMQFIEELNGNWARVRVLDSHVKNPTP